MALDREHYGECLYCDGLVYLNHTGSYVSVSPEDGGGYLHIGDAWQCRQLYECANGPVKCDEDNDVDPEAEGLRRIEDAIDGAGDFSSVTVGDEALERLRSHSGGEINESDPEACRAAWEEKQWLRRMGQ